MRVTSTHQSIHQKKHSSTRRLLSHMRFPKEYSSTARYSAFDESTYCYMIATTRLHCNVLKTHCTALRNSVNRYNRLFSQLLFVVWQKTRAERGRLPD